MWRAMDDIGNLVYPEFVETCTAIMPICGGSACSGGLLYVAGVVMMAVNYVMTWMTRPAHVRSARVSSRCDLSKSEADVKPEPRECSDLDDAPVLDAAKSLDIWTQMEWHRRWERLPVRFTVLTTLAVVVASLFEIIPTFLIRSNVPTIATVKPYTPLELAGRDIFVSEGCYNCHSQMIRPMVAETKRYGEYSKPGEFVYDRPFQWGSRRIGPDLAREGGKAEQPLALAALRESASR